MARMRHGQRVFDADAHIIEPPNLYFDYLEPAFRARVEPDAAIGDHHGRLLPLLDGRPSYGGPAWMHEVLRSDRGRDILVERFGSLAERGFDASAMTEALDAQGIDRAALFPSFSLHVPFTGHARADLAAALADAYNRWIADYCGDGRGRFVGIAVAPLHDPAAAERIARHAVEVQGARAIMVRPNPVAGRTLTHPDNERFFSVIEDLDVALVIHEGRGGVAEFAGDRFDTWYASHAVSHPFEMMLAFTGLTVDGVFDRHPRLRVAVLEAGTGWLRWWLDRLDEHHELFGGHERASLRRRPSEYFSEHCMIGSDSDDHFVRETIDTVGADRVAWSSDFPHLEARYPDGVDVFLARAGLRDDEARRVLWDTPCRLYGFDPTAA
jgi:predicted TIM-barrel fold metal-dependent hydrolase